MNERMWTTQEVATAFSVQNYTVREWLRDGLLVGIKIGRGHYWRIPESSVKELAERKYGDDQDGVGGRGDDGSGREGERPAGGGNQDH